MPASYTHQVVAADAAKQLGLFTGLTEYAALLAGAEGPDPLFFALGPSGKKPYPPLVSKKLHTRRTADLLLTMVEACGDDPLLKSYCCGFFSHYAADSVIHPFVYGHAVTPEGHYSSPAHITLEHQWETWLYRQRGNPTGLPVQMAGFSALSHAQRAQIASLLSITLSAVFPEQCMGMRQLQQCFVDGMVISRALRSSGGTKYVLAGKVLSPLKLDEALRCHMMPPEPPREDVANLEHQTWYSPWEPDRARTESFPDLMRIAADRSAELIRAALAYKEGKLSADDLRTLHGDYSYYSGLPWSKTCSAEEAAKQLTSAREYDTVSMG